MKVFQSFLSISFSICGFFALSTLASEPAISNVKAQQRYPWNGKVDISCEIAGEDSLSVFQVSMVATNLDTGTEIPVQTINAKDGSGMKAVPGTSHFVWNADADVSDKVRFENLRLYVSAEPVPPQYLVFDLSGGPSASSYPVAALAAEPTGGWTDEYKTTKLVLRRIEPGTFKMCGSYNVTLSKAFYIGVFEVTQMQWSLVMGSNPSQYQGNMRPVEQVSYNTIRGSTGWPGSAVVSSTSFIGKLRAKTGIDFDLPTEAQWEYACRAGTTSDYNNGGSSESYLKEVGRYSGDESDGKGGYTTAHTSVGSYIPNAWGLYDMHGNVWEWCLDWYSHSLHASTDPKGASSGNARVIRGGSWPDSSLYCRADYRGVFPPSEGENNKGFRLCFFGSDNEIEDSGEGGEEEVTPEVSDNALYCIIDLSGGSSASSYPVSYLDAVPSGGWSDIYKTKKLVLRRLNSGAFIMGDDQKDNAHRVTLTNPFYIGVFEVTQKQWSLVMGSNPARDCGVGDARPVYCVSYDMIRGSSNGAQWPASSAVDSTSFLGKLRAKTGLDFDLPTEAQWEYACRAGTTTTYYWGNTMNGDYAWYNANSGFPSEKDAHPVGGKMANNWGLYDMSGNVWEWCLDWYAWSLGYGTNPKGDPTGSSFGLLRVCRGGGSGNMETCHTSAMRNRLSPGVEYDNVGFRLSRTLP